MSCYIQTFGIIIPLNEDTRHAVSDDVWAMSHTKQNNGNWTFSHAGRHKYESANKPNNNKITIVF